MSKEMYEIVWFPDEVSLKVAQCKQPWLCTCPIDSSCDPRCGYTAEQAKERLVHYYESRAQDIKNKTVVEFLHDYGIYR